MYKFPDWFIPYARKINSNKAYKQYKDLRIRSDRFKIITKICELDDVYIDDIKDVVKMTNSNLFEEGLWYLPSSKHGKRSLLLVKHD